MDVRLDLTAEELRELEFALEEQRHGLMVELAGADAREFREALRARLSKIETLAARLESAGALLAPS